MKELPTVFLDNIQFRYDPERGLFSCLSIGSWDMTLEEVRRKGVTVSFYEVTVVRGIPYLFDEKADTFYRLGNSNVRISGDDFYLEDLRGMVSYPDGEEFRKVVARERDYMAGLSALRQEDRSSDR